MPSATSIEIETKSNVLIDCANIEENKVDKIEKVKASKITLGCFLKKLKMSSNESRAKPIII
jgi:hypothetical protein